MRNLVPLSRLAQQLVTAAEYDRFAGASRTVRRQSGSSKTTHSKQLTSCRFFAAKGWSQAVISMAGPYGLVMVNAAAFVVSTHVRSARAPAGGEIDSVCGMPSPAAITFRGCHATQRQDSPGIADARRRRLRRGAGVFSQPGMDGRPARGAADRGGGRSVPGVGGDAARSADRHRAGARAADHGREARDQCGDGRLPADAFPGRRDSVAGDAEG